MAQPQLERTRLRSSDHPSPRSAPIAHQTSPTFEQLLRVQETPCTRSQPQLTSSPTFAIHDHDENLSPDSHNRKSVLTKVKEQARKLRHSLSSRKRHEHEMMSDGNSIHMRRSSVAMDVEADNVDDDELDKDPEYLGAPMYESEAAPESLKETARQHPRAVPVVSEKHLTPKCTYAMQDYCDHSPGACPNATSPKCAYSLSPHPHPTVAERVSEKLAHPITAVSDATHNVASKITTGLTTSTPEDPQKGKRFSDLVQSGASPTPRQIDVPGQRHPIRSTPRQIDVPEQHDSRMPSGYTDHKHAGSSSPQMYDKGVSVKEYFMNKLEPGEDERALSHAITEAMSPRSSNAAAGGDRHPSPAPAPGVVDKFRGAVASILAHVAEPSTTTSYTKNGASSSSSNARNYSPQNRTASPVVARPTGVTYSPVYAHIHAKTASPVFRMSTPSRQVVEEENRGKILQAN